ncbi:proteasome subunit alpha type, putative [Theileria equi strain WA]|uniref:Proteasome subunit alpha type n=1 Tax=Theileria equi strain WA TaxID=1537102 RepID=L1LC79_THEEQ|nr:proteasome subunit alpha type, putative [Theileria equi strain WA]EKX72951.1 proteasome subunit alpha type, putative [Theileria equi strain WA]|eukprot:XP_004832403.1 proteasome subunit alpha type, putative [Theileria equi strain WA]
MAGIGAGYDLSVSTFSPDGRVFQVEYATKAVDTAPTAAAMICKDGIVFIADSLSCGVQKEPSQYTNILQAKPAWRIFAVNERIGVVVAGLLPDAQCVVRRAQDECKSFFQEYGTHAPVRVIAERVALFVHAYTLYWHVRPFGVSLLLAGKDITGEYEMFCIEPSGACYKYGGMAIGKGKHVAKTELEKLDLKELTCKESLADLCYIISQCRDEGSMKTSDVQIAWICPESSDTFQMVPEDIANQAKTDASNRMDAIPED